MGRRWLWVGLFVSLALNLFLVGGIVGAGMSGMRLRPPPPGGPGRYPMAQAVRVLTPERQAAWRAGNPEYVQRFGPRMREGRRLSHQAFLRMAEEPYPRDAILAQLAQARALEREGRSAMDQRMVDFAAGLSAAERAEFGRALARPPRPLGRHGPGGRGPHRRLSDGE